MPRLGQTIVHIVLGTGILKGMGPEISPRFMALLISGTAEAVLLGVVKWMAWSVRTVCILQGTALISAQEVAGDPGRHHLVQLYEAKLACAVNRDHQIVPSVISAHFGNVDVIRRAASAKVADGKDLELFLDRLVAGHLGRAADAMPLQATMEQ
jgi:hypothetical protein